MRRPSPSSRNGGFIIMRAGCLGFLFTIALLWGGGQLLYTSLKNRQPVTMTAKEYLAHRPSAEWVHLTAAHVDPAEGATIGFLGTVSELYIPVRSPGDNPGKPVTVLFHTKNAQLVSLMREVGRTKDNPAAQTKILAENAKVLFGPREIMGLVQFGIEADDKNRRKLVNLGMNLSKDFVIIADGETPNLAQGLIMTIGGLALGFFLLRRSAPSRAAPPPLPNLPPRDFGGPP